MRPICPILFMLVLATASVGAERKKVVIPFDFTSKFDQGRYGQQVGELVWKKLEREGGFVIPESMLDVRDTVTSQGLIISPDMALEKMKRIVIKDFGADVAIWGSVERVPGNAWDVYDLKIRCIDFTTGPKPVVLYKVDARTKTVSEIPHVYVKAMLDGLYGRTPGGPVPVDPLIEKNWKNNPNLIRGGDFQRGRDGVPEGWDSRGGQKREPLGNLVRWVTESGNPSNRVIRLTFDKALGDTFGVMYYSDYFPIEEGATYRFQCRWRTDGPEAKVFIKGYDEVASEYKDKNNGSSNRSAKAYVPEGVQRRECYRSQQNLKGPKNQWNTQTQDFTPKHTKYTPRWGRVMLYGFLGAGSVEFDDVVVKQIVPPSPGHRDKLRRHSLESGVTLKEMEENRKRGQQAGEDKKNGTP
ncbi:MAG: hypothetical protein JW818_18180 [Pirellulales bacterium]|nr:hypothetical protein [Pirellulales bacterium]